MAERPPKPQCFISLAVKETIQQGQQKEYFWHRIADCYMSHLIPVTSEMPTEQYFDIPESAKYEVGTVSSIAWTEKGGMAEQGTEHIYEIVSFNELTGVNISDTAAIRRILFAGLPFHNIQRISLLGENTSVVLRLHDEENARDVGILLKETRKLVADSSASGLGCRTVYRMPKTPEDPKRAIYTLPIVELPPEREIISYQYSATSKKRSFFIFEPKEVGSFHVYDASQFLDAFVKRTLTRNRDGYALSFGNRLTNRDIQMLINSLKEILADREAFGEIMKIGDEKTEALIAKELEAVLTSETLVEQILNDDKLTQGLRNLLWQSDDIRKKCIALGKEEWLQEKNAECQDMQDRLAEIGKQITDKTALVRECENLSAEIRRLERLSMEKEAKLLQSQNYMAENISEYRRNVRKMLTDNLGFCGAGDLPVAVTPEPIPCNVVDCQFDFALINNLRQIRFFSGEPAAADIAETVCKVLKAGKHMSVHGSYAPLIADAVSTALEGKRADIVFRCSRFCSLADLNAAVCACPGSIVLVHGVYGEESDSFVIALARLCGSKTIIFSEDTEMPNGPSSVMKGYISGIDTKLFSISEEDAEAGEPWLCAESGKCEYPAHNGSLRNPNFS